MSYVVKLTGSFKKAYKRLSKKYHSFERDVDSLVSTLKSDPHVGSDLGNGIRKVRMAISGKGKGKSGGARVIIYILELAEESGQVTLLAIYDKSEQESISRKDIDELIKGLE